MYVVRVKDRGRDLAVHLSEQQEEARELARVYQVLGYPSEKVQLERVETEIPKAA